MFFEYGDRLVGADSDGGTDVYERSAGTTKLISTGPSGGEDEPARLLAVSDDGSRVIFGTNERLTGGDEDDAYDIYERAGATTTLISTGPDGGDGDFDVDYGAWGGASADATHVVFRTAERLVAQDTDSLPDIYERTGGTTTLVSTGPGDDGAATASFPGTLCPGCNPAETSPISRNGTHVVFYTDEGFVTSDGDATYDFYERTGGITKLVSTGPTDVGGGLEPTVGTEFDMSDDGTRVIFASNERLVAQDVDNLRDVYERANGTTTTLVSTGPGDTHTMPVCEPDEFGEGCRHRISPDGSHIFFYANESLAPQDTGGYLDLYDRSGGTVQLVSIGPAGGNGPFDVDSYEFHSALSDDGSHVFFATREALTSNDTNTLPDIYERSGGTTSLIPTGGQNFFDLRSSTDGTRLIFRASAQLVPADVDSRTDVYERHAGTTTLISTGPTDTHTYDADPAAISDDGLRVFFGTIENLVSTDTVPFSRDLYEKRVAGAGAASASAADASVLPGYKELFNPGGANALP